MRDSESKAKPSGNACREEDIVKAEIEEKATIPFDEEREDPVNFGNQNTCVKIKDSEIYDREGQRMTVNLLSRTLKQILFNWRTKSPTLQESIYWGREREPAITRRN